MTKERPNILWFCTDQQRFDTIHALGNPHINTPNLDRLVEEGVAFTHAFCQSPICTPSRASFLTGRYPGNVRGCMNGNEEWGEGAPARNCPAGRKRLRLRPQRQIPPCRCLRPRRAPPKRRRLQSLPLEP